MSDNPVLGLRSGGTLTQMLQCVLGLQPTDASGKPTV